MRSDNDPTREARVQTWRTWDVRGVQRLVRVEPCPFGGTLWRTVVERGDRVLAKGLNDVPACAVMEHCAARGWDVRRLEPAGARMCGRLREGARG